MGISAAEYVRLLQERSGCERFLAQHPSTIPDISGARELLKAQLGFDDWREEPVGESLDADLRQIGIQLSSYISGTLDTQGKLAAVTLAGIVTGSPNALAARAPDGTPIVLFDASLGTLLAILSLATVVLDIRLHDHNFDRHPGLKGRLPKEEDVAAAATEAISGFLARQPRIPDLRRLAGESGGTIFAALSLAHGEIRFGVAHEFGHVVLGHLEQQALQPLYVHVPGRESLVLDAFVKGRQQELDADVFGAEICWQIANEVDPPDFLLDYPGVYGLGAELFFLHLGLLERVKDSNVGVGIHPEATKRLAAVRRACRSSMTVAQVDAARRCEEAVRALGRLIHSDSP